MAQLEKLSTALFDEGCSRQQCLRLLQSLNTMAGRVCKRAFTVMHHTETAAKQHHKSSPLSRQASDVTGAIKDSSCHGDTDHARKPGPKLMAQLSFLSSRAKAEDDAAAQAEADLAGEPQTKRRKVQPMDNASNTLHIASKAGMHAPPHISRFAPAAPPSPVQASKTTIKIVQQPPLQLHLPAGVEVQGAPTQQPGSTQLSGNQTTVRLVSMVNYDGSSPEYAEMQAAEPIIQAAPAPQQFTLNLQRQDSNAGGSQCVVVPTEDGGFQLVTLQMPTVPTTYENLRPAGAPGILATLARAAQANAVPAYV